MHRKFSNKSCYKYKGGFGSGVCSCPLEADIPVSFVVQLKSLPLIMHGIPDAPSTPTLIDNRCRVLLHRLQVLRQ